jgi:putative phosphoesterase
MIVAAIGDVHANLPALQAVLAHAREHGAQAIWNIGDFVGYGAFPDECVTLLRESEVISIQGNYDEKVLKVKKKLDKWRTSKHPKILIAFEWAYDHLSKENRKYLKHLPEQRTLQVEGWEALLVHGSPASPEEHLGPATPDSRLQELASLTSAKIILCGHSHQPFTRWIGDTLFINTGSVGRPDDGDPRATYALLEITAEQREARHFRVDYDVGKAIQAICAAGLPDDFALMIEQGRNLDAVQKQPDRQSPCS